MCASFGIICLVALETIVHGIFVPEAVALGVVVFGAEFH